MHGMYRITFIIILILVLSNSLAYAQNQAVKLYIPDGQFIDRPVRVYVIGIDDALLVNPRLCLVKLKKEAKGAGGEDPCRKDKEKNPFDRAKDQQLQRKIKGSDVPLSKTGTLLLFNLQDFHIPRLQPGTRILPILHYGNEQTIVADREVYICHRSGTIFVVIIIVAPLILILSFLARDDHYLMGLLSTADGRMSVSLTQMFLWTVAVGASVLALGITRLEIPYIPETLVILMGLSVTTSVVGHWQTDSLIEEKRKREEDIGGEEKPKLKDLVTLKVPNAVGDADLGKAQLLFWTIITLAIFVIKSIVEGELWAVPAELLVLMGISQAGFLTRKQFLVHQEKKETEKKETEKEGAGKNL